MTDFYATHNAVQDEHRNEQKCVMKIEMDDMMAIKQLLLVIIDKLSTMDRYLRRDRKKYPEESYDVDDKLFPPEPRRLQCPKE